MNLLLVTEDYPPAPGGIATFLYNICLFTKFDISVLTVKWESCDEFDKKQSYFTKRIAPLRYLGFLSFFLNVLYLVIRRRIDIIFWGYCVPLAITGWLVKSILNVRLAVLVHGNDLNCSLSQGRMSRCISLFVLRRCDVVFTNCSYNRDILLKLGLFPERIKIFHPGVDISVFYPESVDGELQKRYNLSGKKVILTVGRLVQRKGQRAVVEVLADIVNKIPDVIYVIAGDGPDKYNLDVLVRKLGLGQNVVFIPDLSYDLLPAMYNLCDLFVMVSKEIPEEGEVEGFGIVFSEAGACGKPVVGGRSGGIPDAVVDGVTGILVDPEDREELREAICSLLSDPEKAQVMGRNGRQRMLNELTWEKVVGEFDDELESLLSK